MTVKKSVVTIKHYKVVSKVLELLDPLVLDSYEDGVDDTALENTQVKTFFEQINAAVFYLDKARNIAGYVTREK